MNWLKTHGPIRVGYIEDYLPFCASDPETGELTGALRSFLDLAAHSVSKAELNFTAIPYPTIKDALNALQNGKTDCVFPINLSIYDGEMLNISVTTPFIDTEVYAAIRKSDHLTSFADSDLTVAVSEGNYSVNTFLNDYFPDMNILYFPNEADSFRAVSEGSADGTLFSNYRLTQTEKYRKQYKLTSMPTGKTMSFSFAIRRSDGELYHIMMNLSIMLDTFS